METEFLVGSVIQDPFERVVIRVSACMISEPKCYESAESRVADIVADLKEIVKLEPEFVCKLAYYSRNELNLRGTSNFILAWAATQFECRVHLSEFFPFTINLPSDLLDFIEKYQNLIGDQDRVKLPTFIQTLVKRKFLDFSVYQLGKYCSEGKRKRILISGKQKIGKLNMKSLVKGCHVKKPAFLVASIVGKRYPSTL